MTGAALLVLLALAIFMVYVPARAGRADDGGTLWRSLRQHSPYHLQSIACTTDPASPRTVIVAEPPPHASAPRIAELLGASEFEVQNQPIGYDGWARDVVLHPGVVGDHDMSERLDALAAYLYGSSSGLHCIPLPPPAETTSAGELELDYRIGANDLYRWLVTEKLTLNPDVGSASCVAPELLGTRSAGIFRSEPAGLLVWAVPVGEDLQQHARACRRWLADSDLVLGAIRGKGSLLIIARERRLPVDAFPALRVEEVMRLASVQTDELVQSYERTHALAGRFNAQHEDWAPILLSPELVDTELGSLLNITDQLLKSWSEAGTVAYTGFTYPAPSAWPFNKPLSEVVGAEQLTFNWNTKGVGYEVEYPDGCRVFALHRTGALPVSYIPGGEASDEPAPEGRPDVSVLEEQGYDYFAASHDPRLARVVQYTALFQIFRDLGVHSSFEAQREPSHTGDDVLAHSVRNALQRLIASSDDDLDKLTEQVGKWFADTIRTVDDAEGVMLASQMELESYRAALNFRDFVKEMPAAEREPFLDAMARVLGPLRMAKADEDALEAIARKLNDSDAPLDDDADPALTLEEKQLARAWMLSRAMQSPDLAGLRVLMQYLCRSARGDYARALEARPPQWIRTPSIVISHANRSIDVVGGHNLSSKATRFVIDSELEGAPRLVAGPGGPEWRVPAKMAEGLGEASRGVARAGDMEAQIQRIVDAASQSKPRSLTEAIPATGSPPAPPGIVPPPAARTPFPSDDGRWVVFEPESCATTNGRRYFKVDSVIKKTDEVLDVIEASPVGAEVRVRVPERMTDAELDAFTSTLRARKKPDVPVVIFRGESPDTLRSIDMTGATLKDVSTSGSQVVEATLSGKGDRPTFVVRISAKFRDGARSLATLVRDRLVNRAAPGQLVSPREFFINLNEVEGLDGLHFQIRIRDKGQSHEFYITGFPPEFRGRDPVAAMRAA